jgi:hypothetical protein
MWWWWLLQNMMILPSLDGHAVMWPWEERHGRGWHWRSMKSVNQTRPHCVNHMGKTHSKPLAAQHGRGTAWARHAVCESAYEMLTTVNRNEALYHPLVFNCSTRLREEWIELESALARWAVNGCSKYSNSRKTVWTRGQCLSSNKPTINWQIRHQSLHKTRGKMKICVTSFDTISRMSKRSTKS